jgi:hypothetical protein
LELPFGLGRQVTNFLLTEREAARYDQQEFSFIRPPHWIWPKLLSARHYFGFGKPFETSNINHKDRASCQRLYEDIQDETKRGVRDLLRARQHDPSQDSKRRFLHHFVTGKAPPTFFCGGIELQVIVSSGRHSECSRISYETRQQYDIGM